MTKKLLLLLLLIILSGSRLWAQDRTISGTVNTEEGTTGFAGATVLVKGTSTGTVTDVNGKYALTGPPLGATLVFSAVGMETVEEPVGGRTTINVTLKTDSRQLGEIVITALGTKAQRDRFASSISTLDGKNIAKTGETSLLTGLRGCLGFCFTDFSGHDSNHCPVDNGLSMRLFNLVIFG